MNHQTALHILQQNQNFKSDYQQPDLALAIAESLIIARSKKKLSQAEVAALVGTKQSSIARLENGSTLPSLRFLQRVAKVLDLEIQPLTFKRKPKKSLQSAPLTELASLRN